MRKVGDMIGRGVKGSAKSFNSSFNKSISTNLCSYNLFHFWTKLLTTCDKLDGTLGLVKELLFFTRVVQ